MSKFVILFSIAFSTMANANLGTVAEAFIEISEQNVEAVAEKKLTIDAQEKCATQNVKRISDIVLKTIYKQSSHWYGAGEWPVGYNAKAVFECLP